LNELDLHDAYVETVDLGPRREVVLRLVRPVRSGPIGTSSVVVLLRFGAIENFDEARQFFAGLARSASGAYLDQVLNLARTKTGWVLELDHLGAIEIRSAKPPIIEQAG
jgi:hypothetical protein